MLKANGDVSQCIKKLNLETERYIDTEEIWGK